MDLPIIRQCTDCSTCCRGWLPATIRGHCMSPGTPCFFLKEKKCSIYSERPADPCQHYHCEWLLDNSIPDEMKPNVSNVIISPKQHPTDRALDYYEIVEAGKKMDATVLNWIFKWSLANNKNIIYQVDGKLYTLGSPAFIEVTNKLNNL